MMVEIKTSGPVELKNQENLLGIRNLTEPVYHQCYQPRKLNLNGFLVAHVLSVPIIRLNVN